jgi:hypothetical protein
MVAMGTKRTCFYTTSVVLGVLLLAPPRLRIHKYLMGLWLPPLLIGTAGATSSSRCCGGAATISHAVHQV